MAKNEKYHAIVNFDYTSLYPRYQGDLKSLINILRKSKIKKIFIL
jgi:hypothetical protein